MPTMNQWAGTWATAVWSQLGMCNPILCSACQLIQASSLLHLAALQSSAKVLICRVPQDPFLRCLGAVWGAKEVLILLDGVSTAYSVIYTEGINCSHTRWLHLFHDTFSQGKDGDTLESILVPHSCSQPSQAQIQHWLAVQHLECLNVGWCYVAHCFLGVFGSQRGNLEEFDKLATFEWGLKSMCGI